LFEKDEKVGGLLRYGIPDFKLSKVIIDRRIRLMSEEGLMIKTDTFIGKDITGRELLNRFDAICIAIGAAHPRDLLIEGRDLKGIHFAMDYLIRQNRLNAGQYSSRDESIIAEGRNVLIIGGGDTGSDCVGTAIRQKAESVTQIEILPKPPLFPTADNLWPDFRKTLKTSTSQEEGCERMWSLSVVRFIGLEGHITGVEAEEVEWNKIHGKLSMTSLPGTKRIINTDFIVLAMGFVHTVIDGLVTELDLDLDQKGNIKVDQNLMTSRQKVFAAGDSVCGASLVVNAIASGRKAAKEIDKFLMNIAK
jgi:glutamate synthase (NADPH/NADH) small chain